MSGPLPPFNMSGPPPAGLRTFGGSTICNLDICPAEWSIYTYRPSLAANIAFIAIFGAIGLVHSYLGYRWKSWGFMVGMQLGCIVEIIGYIGRVMLYNNPFSFDAFLIQIVCLTIAPVFYTASIYVTLSKTINHLDPSLSRFKPNLFYWIFIPFDVVCLILQGAGGALSTMDSIDSDIGVAVSMTGLILQVLILVLFIAAFADYISRYWRAAYMNRTDSRLVIFLSGLAVSIIFILARCIYRVAELKDGYSGDLIKHEVPFIVMEGVFITVAAISLAVGHPGVIFGNREATGPGSKLDSGTDCETTTLEMTRPDQES